MTYIILITAYLAGERLFFKILFIMSTMILTIVKMTMIVSNVVICITPFRVAAAQLSMCCCLVLSNILIITYFIQYIQYICSFKDTFYSHYITSIT